MVWVVSAGALLKVCLPDYLLWMSDLSPLLNFEPFTEVLRNEQSTWLSDILVREFATVQMKAPCGRFAASAGSAPPAARSTPNKAVRPIMGPPPNHGSALLSAG